MKTIWITALLLASTGSVKAQDIPPLAPLRGDVASLADTMKFIQEKLPGTVNYMMYGHNSITGTDDPPTKMSFTVTGVSANAGHCSISFHLRSKLGNNNPAEMDKEISLKQVEQISLVQREALLQQSTAKNGQPEHSFKIDPPIPLVVVQSAPNHSILVFNFYDDAFADRVSKALQHAVSLCGGGKPETF